MNEPRPTGRIDVHHHVLPLFYAQALHSIGADKSGGAPLPDWNLLQTLQVMDEQAVRAAVLSISAPGVYFGDEAFARELAPRCNDFLAQLRAGHPERFGALALLPLPDVEASLRELQRALDELQLDGVLLQSSYGPWYLGDEKFAPLMDELNRRGASILLHPTSPPGSEESRFGLPPFLVDFVFDTTRAVAKLIFEGTMERCPNINWILAHAGGAAPYLAGRLEQTGKRLPDVETKAPLGVIEYLKRFHYDTALSATPYAFAALQQLVPPSQILFGSDYPYVPPEAVGQTAEGVTSFAGFDEAARRAIESDNARRLFPRLETR